MADPPPIDGCGLRSYASAYSSVKIAILPPMLPTPDEGLHILGSTIRAARKARALTQQRTAKEAGVSRAQLALLEKGENVSVRFVLKIARFLDLSDIPLDGTVRFTSGRGAVNFLQLIESADLLVALAEHLRTFAIDAIVPPSQRAALKDTPAVRQFLERHGADAAGFAALTEAIVHLSHEAPAPALPETARVDESKSAAATRRRKRSA